MVSWLKLSHHSHTGRLRPHEHTSYLPLGFLLLLVGIGLTAFTATAASPPPQAGSVGLTGIMPGKPPTTAAHITAPASGQHFSTSPVTFKGTCPSNTLVEIFKNDIFAGSVPCSNSGTFSLDVDLLIGKNTVVARVYDALNQKGPDSNSVIVYYDALPPQGSPLNALNFGGSQLLLNTDAIFRGAFPDHDLVVPINIIGGTAPYAVNVQWGDTVSTMVPRKDNAPFKVAHAYAKPGTYQISLQATDSTGRVAFLTVASIVNGQPPVVAAPIQSSPSMLKNLLLLWPLYTAAVAVVSSFWLGEWREKHVLMKHGQLVA